MVGAGRAGRMIHSNSIMRHVPGGEVVAIVNLVSEVSHAISDGFGIPDCFDTLETALEQSQFDAVVIIATTFDV